MFLSGRTQIAIVVTLAVATAVGWRYRHAEWVQSLMPASEPAPKPFVFDKPEAITPLAANRREAKPQAPPRPVAGVRKCRSAEKTVYTDQDCPPGTKEEVVARGAINVMPGMGDNGSLSAQSSTRSGPDANAVNIRERQMEQAIYR